MTGLMVWIAVFIATHVTPLQEKPPGVEGAIVPLVLLGVVLLAICWRNTLPDPDDFFPHMFRPVFGAGSILLSWMAVGTIVEGRFSAWDIFPLLCCGGMAVGFWLLFIALVKMGITDLRRCLRCPLLAT